MAEEAHVWSGTPSQVLNLPTFLLCGLFFWLVFPLFIMLWKWLVVKSTKYELTSQRLMTRYGVINKKMDELELYRVKDYKLDEPFFLRIFSLGNIFIEASDKSHSNLVIKAVPNVEELRNLIRTNVERRRDEKGVREVDIE